MASLCGPHEIVEDLDQCSKGTNTRSAESRKDDKAGKHPILQNGRNYSIENDLNEIFQAIDLRISTRALGQLHQRDTGQFQKNALKKPVRAGASQGSGVGISESVTLKQALRGLCISQKLEMAAMKRLSKPASVVSEAGTIKRLYRAVVVEASESGRPLDESKGSVVEISFVPEDSSSNSSEKIPEFLQVHKAKVLSHNAQSSPQFAVKTKTKVQALPQDEIVPASTDGSETSNIEPVSKWKSKSAHSTSGSSAGGEVLEVGEIIPAATEVGRKNSTQDLWKRGKLHPVLSLPSSRDGSKISKSAGTNMHLAKPVFRNKSFVKKKGKQDLTSATSSSCMSNKIVSGSSPITSKSVSQTDNCTESNSWKEPVSPASISTSQSVEVSSKNTDYGLSKPSCTLNKCDSEGAVGTKVTVASRSKEKGDFSQSSKSSNGEYSSSTSISEESTLSGSSCGNRPHMSKDMRWEAIHHVQMQHGRLGMRHFRLHKRLGSGDIGTVYLAELMGTNCLFALKVMDNKFLASRKKMPRAQTEREILQMLDHPFLPTLYAHFTTEKLSCLVMDYCPGGDLHVLRQKQPGRSFLEQAARFYAAEVLLALEYLHMLGVIYRDLKPENILVREDGHIMLTDFDLSLRCTVSPTILKSSSMVDSEKKLTGPCSESSCIHPFCMQPSWVPVSCFTPRLIASTNKTKRLNSDMVAQVRPLPQLVAEPTSARSNSFVGTHEYLAPEIIKGEGHGSAVDWWTFGIFLYELLFGKTPFKGSGNEETLANVVLQGLRFPESPMVSLQAKDLIRGLLVKEPENRLGSTKGAAEIKQHSFFEGLNWALVRCAIPPELPRFTDLAVELYKKESKCLEYSEEHLEFELF